MGQAFGSASDDFLLMNFRLIDCRVFCEINLMSARFSCTGFERAPGSTKDVFSSDFLALFLTDVIKAGSTLESPSHLDLRLSSAM